MPPSADAINAARRIGVERIEVLIEPELGRAIRAENGGLLPANFEIDMQVVLGRRCADTFKRLNPDPDLRHTVVVREFRAGLKRQVDCPVFGFKPPASAGKVNRGDSPLRHHGPPMGAGQSPGEGLRMLDRPDVLRTTIE